MTNREQLFDVLSQMLDRYPDFRFGQLVCNLADWGEQQVWDIEDDQLLEIARDHLSRRVQRETEAKAD